jgi:glycosyltransferase involved in cell wall biosynthesis
VNLGADDTHVGRRLKIAFFGYHDVFEDFYPHYGVTQLAFATEWAGTGAHAFVATLQKHVGDVTWYASALAPDLASAHHRVTGCEVKFLQSSWLHRQLWRAYYWPKIAWRVPRLWQRARVAHPVYAMLASYTALLSRRTFATLRADQPDIFFVQDYATGRFDVLLLLARMLGAPLVAVHMGSRPEHYVGRLTKRWSIPHADRLIASSRTELEMLARRYGVVRDHLDLILTPIDTTTYQPMDRTQACHAVGLDPARRYLLYVGRLDDAVKRVSLLMRTFAHLASTYPDADLLIVGDGPDGARLRSLAAELGSDRIRFVGWVTDAARKAHFYNAAECLVLCSRSEGFPTVVGEAMSCGTPVLGSRVGGIPEVVTDGETGWLIGPDDVAALGRQLEFVLAHPEAVERMRPRAREVAETRVSPDSVGLALRQCFTQALEHAHA